MEDILEGEAPSSPSPGDKAVEAKKVSESSASVGVKKAYKIIKKRIKSGKLISSSSEDKSSSAFPMTSMPVNRSDVNFDSVHDRHTIVNKSSYARISNLSVDGLCSSVEPQQPQQRNSSTQIRRVPSNESDVENRQYGEFKPTGSRQASLSSMSNGSLKQLSGKHNNSTQSRNNLLTGAMKGSKDTPTQITFSTSALALAEKNKIAEEKVIGGILYRTYVNGAVHASCMDGDGKDDSEVNGDDSPTFGRGINRYDDLGDKREIDGDGYGYFCVEDGRSNRFDDMRSSLPKYSNTSPVYKFRDLDGSKSSAEAAEMEVKPSYESSSTPSTMILTRGQSITLKNGDKVSP